jgi:alkanesulfonate monooxygenase SsuD/methylene tetrahydromethanopterin reductase-like flavin-dependent oxidoreductase (luciferase family)
MAAVVRAQVRATASATTRRAASSTCGPARVNTLRWWWGSEWVSRRCDPAAAPRALTTDASRPSLTLITHSSTPRGSRSYDRRVDVGLVLPAHQPWERAVNLAATAEGLGFRSLWIADSFGGPASNALEPLTALAGLARTTVVARLGAFLGPGVRPPAVAAKALATTDVLSGGRVTVGIVDDSPGADTPGADTPGDDPPGAGVAGALGEAVQIMRGAFGGGPFTFHGEHHRVEGLRCRPRPLQRPAPPIWVSGRGEAVLAVAAQHADGWGPSGSAVTIEEYRRAATALDQACDEFGRDPADIHRFVCREAPVGSLDLVSGQVALWAETGVATLILDVGTVASGVTSGDDLEQELEMLASAVSQ